jgi:hypothetical protein
VGERRGAYSVLVGRYNGKRTLGSPRLRGKDIKIYLKEMEWGGGGLCNGLVYLRTVAGGRLLRMR